VTISSIFQTNDANVSQTTIPNTSSNSQIDSGPAYDVIADRPISGLAISTSYSGFRILITVNVDATTDVSETFDLLGTSDGTNWTMSQNAVQSVNGSANILFTIDSSGQIKYTSTATPGFVKRTLQWLKQVL
jgi:hypothetical protein